MRLGKIDDLTDWAAALGSGAITWMAVFCSMAKAPEEIWQPASRRCCGTEVSGSPPAGF